LPEAAGEGAASGVFGITDDVTDDNTGCVVLTRCRLRIFDVAAAINAAVADRARAGKGGGVSPSLPAFA
jgi:hypothetical protein